MNALHAFWSYYINEICTDGQTDNSTDGQINRQPASIMPPAPYSGIKLLLKHTHPSDKYNR